MKNQGLGVVLLGLLGSCASHERRVYAERAAAAQAQLETADCGPQPAFHRSMAKAVFDRVLKDPESARITYHELRKGWVCAGIDDPGVFCWKMPVTLNAKNAFGGYTGLQGWEFWFRGEQMLGVRDGEGRMIYTLPAAERNGVSAPGK